MEILFPKNISCIFCSSPISRSNPYSLCKRCYQKLNFVQELCIHCGRFGKGASMCTQCEKEQYGFDQVYCTLEYNDLMHKQIYSYKYGHQSFMAEYLGAIMKDFVTDNQLTYDFITGVPISKQRMGERGFNQSDELALAIDSARFVHLFRRKKNTSFLSGLSKAGRILELEDAFEVNQEQMDKLVEQFYCVEGNLDKKIKLVIVDDIITTGSTLNELSKCIKKQLDVEVTVLTLCSARK